MSGEEFNEMVQEIDEELNEVSADSAFPPADQTLQIQGWQWIAIKCELERLHREISDLVQAPTPDQEWEDNIHAHLDSLGAPREDSGGNKFSINGRFELLRTNPASEEELRRESDNAYMDYKSSPRYAEDGWRLTFQAGYLAGSRRSAVPSEEELRQEFEEDELL